MNHFSSLKEFLAQIWTEGNQCLLSQSEFDITPDKLHVAYAK